MSSYWSPKPLRPMGTTGGIFSYDSEEPVVKSSSNRWQNQRRQDGTPYTRHGASALVPPPAGPKLVLNDLEKSQTDKEVVQKSVDPELIVKGYLEMHEHFSKGALEAGQRIGQKVMSAANTVTSIAGTSGKSLKEGEDDPTDIEK